MVCAYCGSKTSVVNSRRQHKLGRVWRRRSCSSCGAIFTTIEALDCTSALMVQESVGSLKPFERDKLFVSLYESLKHRPEALTEAGYLTDTVISKLTDKIEGGAISQSAIKHAAQIVLERFDKPAAVHYRAYYNKA